MSETPKTPEYPITRQDQEPAYIPDLAALLDKHGRDLKAQINCVQVGTIQNFDPDKQRASVSLNFFRIVEKTVKPYPIMVDVPVVVLTGGAGALTFPINAGDQCLVFFCDRNMDSWAVTGLLSPPESERVHDLSDGIALVGIRPIQNPILSYESNGVHLYHGDDKDAKLSLEAAVKAQLLHKTARCTLIDGQEATLTQGSNEVSVQDKISLKVGSQTLKLLMDQLCDVLTNWVDTRGDTPNSATLTAIANLKTAMDGFLK